MKTRKVTYQNLEKVSSLLISETIYSQEKSSELQHDIIFSELKSKAWKKGLKSIPLLHKCNNGINIVCTVRLRPQAAVISYIILCRV